MAKHDRTVLRQLGYDIRDLSAAEIAKGAKIVARLTKGPCSGGTPAKWAKADADLQVWENAPGLCARPVRRRHSQFMQRA
jgi:hypothetical protein